MSVRMIFSAEPVTTHALTIAETKLQFCNIRCNYSKKVWTSKLESLDVKSMCFRLLSLNSEEQRPPNLQNLPKQTRL